MNQSDLKKKYIDFFVSKGHAYIPSASVIPENDPTCLFNTAGMQPLVPYLKGESHPLGKRLVDFQKCVRLTDLEEVGDETHHTFFEMLGNWSLGDYFKKDAIGYSFEFLTDILHIPVERLAITVFKGNAIVPADDESASIWKSLGICEDRIAYLGEEDNWWPNMEMIGPCGPDTEIFYFRSNDAIPDKFDPEDDRWVEIWNNVFMQYHHNEDGTFTPLKNKNVDTGMGYERVVAVLEGVHDNYLSSIWRDVICLIEEISHKKYEDYQKSMRIVADHIRTAVFISGDDALIKPSNTDQGYILRRLIRRAIRHASFLEIDIHSDWEKEIALLIIDKYKEDYPELLKNKDVILEVLSAEKVKFNRTLSKGLKEFEKLVSHLDGKVIEKEAAFRLFDTFGFPIELTVELALEHGLDVDVDGFHEKFREHQEKSRSNSAAKFKGGLASTGDMEVKYHTATHLLNAALKKVLGNDTHQRGSNITAERMRFDFNCDHKLTEEEKRQVEELVNSWIETGLEVRKCEMKKGDAVRSGAEAMFIDKYGDEVIVYSIGDVSREICGGPHVANTKELGHFKIKKEEASSSGIRRIKAVLE